MKHYAVRDTGVSISERGLGTWNITDSFWGKEEAREFDKILQIAFEAGITHIDTAAVYGDGRSEELLGRQLTKEKRKQLTIASKSMPYSLEKFKTTFELCLQRLKTDYLDIFYIHWPREGRDLRPHMETMENWRREGRIRAIGVSNFSEKDLRSVMKVGTVDLHQIGYNLIWRLEETRSIPFCQKHGIGLVYYSPLAHGLLTGKFNSQEGRLFEKENPRSISVLTYPEVWKPVREVLIKMEKLAQKSGISLTKAALQWLTSRHGALCTLVGCRTTKQAQENCYEPTPLLSREQLQEFSLLSDSLKEIVAPYPNLFNIR